MAQEISVPCSNCNAAPGEPCTQPTDTGRRPVKWFHFVREIRAQLKNEKKEAES